MRSFIASALALALYVSAASAAPWQPKDPAEQKRVREIHEAALKKPFDDSRVQAYLATLPQVGDLFVVEGDLAMTEQQVRAYLVSQSQFEKTADPRELLVDKRDGVLNYYKDPGSRKLTYAIDKASFGAGYTSLTTWFEAAAKEWEDACPECGIDFIHRTELDTDAAGMGTANFVLRQTTLAGFMALAFFPSDPPARRVLAIAPSFFTDAYYSKVGVLRHEIGHILGYRHEQNNSGVTGCFRDTERPGEWAPLTSYDAGSAMHYPCDFQWSREFVLSDTDKKGHRALYKQAGPSAAPSTPAVQAGGLIAPNRELMRQVVLNSPANPQAFKTLLEILPKDDSYFVVEGDLLMTEEELRAHLIAQNSTPSPVLPPDQLRLNVVKNAPDSYGDPKKRKLTYAIDREGLTAEQYSRLVANVHLAAERWEDACEDCGLEFVHLEQNAPATNLVNFVVRLHDAKGAYAASSFFPHETPERRYINIDPGYFKSQSSRVGILRHALGHVLGYRHAAGETRACFSADGFWIPVDESDSTSVMRVVCGDGGATLPDLSGLDKVAHARFYGLTDRDRRRALEPLLATSEASCEASSGEDCSIVVVRLAGGDLAKGAATVVRTLQETGVVDSRSYELKAGETLSEVYRRDLNLPGYDSSMNWVASQVNPNRDFTKLGVHEAIRIPVLQFETYQWARQFDLSDESDVEKLKNIRTHWKDELQRTQANSRWVTAILEGYELKVAVPSSRLSDVAKALTAVQSPNIIPLIETQSPETPRLYSTPSLRSEDWAGQPRADNFRIARGLQGFTGSALGLEAFPPCVDQCLSSQICPELVVLDAGTIHLHPDLQNVVTGGGYAEPPNTLLDGEQGQIAEMSLTVDKTLDHATQIAGLIASEDNDFGLVGINPKATLISRDWFTKWDGNNLPGTRQSILNLRYTSTRQQVFVVATEWAPDAAQNDPIETTIRDQGASLWIVAAGDTPGGGADLKPEDPRLPMRLGASKNVLVVTACEDCFAEGGPVRLSPTANRSTQRLVHVAAPGEARFPTTISKGRYATMGGTSQATAFVAGVASAMLGCFPSPYANNPGRLKTQLQLTATPSLADDQSASVTGGVIDADLALRDPGKSWIRTDGKLKELKPMHWCRDSLRLLDTITHLPLQNGVILTSEVYRTVQLPGGRGTVVFTSKPGLNSGNVKSTGPGVLDPQGLLLRTQEGFVRGSDVRELLLAAPLPAGECNEP